MANHGSQSWTSWLLRRPNENFDHLPVACSVVLLGNSGVGKSYLCNLLMQQNAFDSRYSVSSVTDHLEAGSITVHAKDKAARLQIYNVPGLIESEQDKIERNKREIARAFDGNPVFVFIVLSLQEGRPRREDLEAVSVLKKGLNLTSQNVSIIVNNLPPERQLPAHFHMDIRRIVDSVTGFQPEIIYVPRMDGFFVGRQKKRVFERILYAIKDMQPVRAQNVHIELNEDVLKREKADLERKIKEHEEMVRNMTAQAKDNEEQALQARETQRDKEAEGLSWDTIFFGLLLLGGLIAAPEAFVPLIGMVMSNASEKNRRQQGAPEP